MYTGSTIFHYKQSGITTISGMIVEQRGMVDLPVSRLVHFNIFLYRLFS